nr:hypothetical protein [Chryseobacterium sp. T16E-39]
MKIIQPRLSTDPSGANYLKLLRRKVQEQIYCYLQSGTVLAEMQVMPIR